VEVSEAEAFEDEFDVRSLAATFRDGHLMHTHDHPWAQLVYARSGVMHVTVEGRVWFVPPTRAIWIPNGVRHCIGVQGEVALRTLYIASERAGPLKRDVEALEVSALLSEMILYILSIGMLDPKIAEHDRLAGVLMDLIATAPGTDLALPLPRDLRALKLAEHLRGDPADRRDLDTLAAETGASLRTLQRCFSEETGLTIEQWRQKARLVHSAAQLASGASVTDAAIGCGYDSPSAYIAAFRRQFGVTPGRFTAD
jgi:AraC-like DNA-binding protein/mannose-6-phosphate isomerase-like protein (cupin superfamily)